MDTAVEKYLSEVESFAAPIYEALLQGKIPAKGTLERQTFAIFIALMYTRTPGQRRMIGELIGRQLQVLCYAYGISETAFNTLSGCVERDVGRDFSADERECIRQIFIDPSGYKLRIPKEQVLPIMLGTAHGLMPAFSSMKWTLIDAAQSFFITSDNPVVREVDPKSIHSFYGDGGISNPTAQIIFPLSRKRALMMTWRENFPDTASVSGDYVWWVNKALAANSDRQLYAHIEHKKITKLSGDFKDSRPNMTSSGFGPEKFATIEVPRKSRRQQASGKK